MVTVVKRRLRIGSNPAYGIEQKLTGQAREFYLSEASEIRSALTAFLTLQKADLKAQYVRKTSKVPGVMGRFYQSEAPRHLAAQLEEEPLVWNVVYELEPSFVEVVWRDKQGESFEAVFVKEEGGWKLDWEHFARYSAIPWTYFRQQFGTQREGVFRLYMEEVSRGGGGEEGNVWVRLMPPVADVDARAREATDPVAIPRNSELGIKVLKALDHDRVRPESGFPKLYARDPEKLTRVQLRLAWERDESLGTESMRIVDLLANHWRGEGLEGRLKSEVGEPGGESEEL